MTRRTISLSLGLLLISVTGAWFAQLYWSQQKIKAIACTGVAAQPDLRRWPAEFSESVRRESAAVQAGQAPLAALGRLAALYYANGYQAEAVQALIALRQLEPQNARWPYWQADLHWRAGNSAAAEAALLITIAKDAHYAPAWLRLGDLLSSRGELKRAEECFRQAIAVEPNSVRAAYEFIQFAAMHGRAEQVLRQRLESLAHLHPEIKDIHELLAGMFEGAHDVARAAQERTQAAACEVVISTEDPWVDDLIQLSYDTNRLMLRAVAMRREGRWAAAELLLQKVVKLSSLDAVNPLGWDLLSDLYLKLARPAEARALLEKAIEKYPNEFQLSLLLTRLLTATHDSETAIVVGRQAVERWPQRGELHAALGQALHESGRSVEALPVLREAIQRDPTMTEIHYYLGVTLMQLGKRSAAQAAFAQVLAMRPQHPGALYALAAIDLEAGDFVAAEPHIFQLRDIDPQGSSTLMLLAAWHLLKGLAASQAVDLEEALKHYRAGLVAVPDDPAIRREVGLIAAQREQWGEAAQQFEHCLRVAPTDSRNYISLGRVLRKLGQMTAASTILQRGWQVAQQAGDQERMNECKQLLSQ